MTAATAALVALGLALTVVAGPLYTLTDRAAADLIARTPYITAVFAQTVDDRWHRPAGGAGECPGPGAARGRPACCARCG